MLIEIWLLDLASSNAFAAVILQRLARQEKSSSKIFDKLLKTNSLHGDLDLIRLSPS